MSEQMSPVAGAASNLPPGSFGAGTVGELKEFKADPRRFVWARYRCHGRIFRSHLEKPVAFMMGPAANRAFLHTYNDRLTWGKAFPQQLQRMLFNERNPDAAPSPAGTFALADGEQMRGLKQIASTAFHPDQLAGTVDSMNACIDEALLAWSRQPRVHLYEAAKAMLFRSIWSWLTGAEEDEFRAQVVREVYNTFTRLPESIQGKTPAEVLRSKHIARISLETYLRRLVQARHSISTEDVLSAWAHKADKDGNRFTENQMVKHAILFMITGDEATAITLSWVLLALHQYPDAWERLRAEVEQTLGDAPFSFDHARKLTYLNCLLKEVERMYSPAFGPMRFVLEPFEFDGYTVPAGWHARLCNFVSHSMEDAFENPERFDPDRFAEPREEDKRTPYSLVGFGGGPRICIGRPFSMLFMAAFLVELVRGYELELLPDQNLSPHLVRNALFVPKDGLLLKVKRLRSGGGARSSA